MKNDIFNFSRFGKYFVSDLKSCWANYGLSLLCLSLLSYFALYFGSILISYIGGEGWDGPSIYIRPVLLGVIMACIIITMPVKCYGRLTEKQYGSFWLNIPASRLEKYLSMIIITCIAVPATGAILFLSADALVCAIDPTCGDSIIKASRTILLSILEMESDIQSEVASGDMPEIMQQFINSITNPVMYIDDLFGMSLPFLLGAIFFKSGKTVKTFIAIAIGSTVISMISLPILVSFGLNISETVQSEAELLDLLENHAFFRNIEIWDTISDTLFNVALLTGIWFRLKTLKH